MLCIQNLFQFLNSGDSKTEPLFCSVYHLERSLYIHFHPLYPKLDLLSLFFGCLVFSRRTFKVHYFVLNLPVLESHFSATFFFKFICSWYPSILSITHAYLTKLTNLLYFFLIAILYCQCVFLIKQVVLGVFAASPDVLSTKTFNISFISNLLSEFFLERLIFLGI